MSIEMTAAEQSALKSALAALDLPVSAAAAATASADLSPRELFCRYWPILKRVLEFLASVPVLPASVKGAIATVIAAGDTVSKIICH